MAIQNLSDALISVGESFHEATVTDFIREGVDIRLRCEGMTSSRQPTSFTILFEGVSSIAIDGNDNAGPLMEAADGEGLSVADGHAGLEFLIEWNDWDKRASWTRHYAVSAKAIRLLSD